MSRVLMSRRLILLIDDSRNFVEGMAMALSAHKDLTIVTATDALDGYAIARERKPDLVVLDVTMPIVDGWTVLRKMRSNPALVHIPVVMMTGVDRETALAEANRLDVRYVLTKPVTIAELTDAIRQSLSDAN
jgi:CheY-like chemotaxis protein